MSSEFSQVKICCFAVSLNGKVRHKQTRHHLANSQLLRYRLARRQLLFHAFNGKRFNIIHLFNADVLAVHLWATAAVVPLPKW